MVKRKEPESYSLPMDVSIAGKATDLTPQPFTSNYQPPRCRCGHTFEMHKYDHGCVGRHDRTRYGTEKCYGWNP